MTQYCECLEKNDNFTTVYNPKIKHISGAKIREETTEDFANPTWWLAGSKI